MQQILPSIALTTHERYDLYNLCLKNIDKAELWLPGWFALAENPDYHPIFEDIYRENFSEWLSWAFFSLPLEYIIENQALNEELRYMISRFENTFHFRFNEGYNENIIAYRISFDPVLAYYRPFLFYVSVLFLTTIFGFLCKYVWGMKKFGPESRLSIWNLVDPQQNSYIPFKSGPEKVSYWFRDGNRDKKPIVFIHGIGGGLMCYYSFLAKLMTLDAPIFCLELPFVAMNCVEEVPSMQETIMDMQKMLKRHEFFDAVFVSHSLGTAVTSWAVKYMPKNIAGLVFIDPICFMLHYKDVCRNFVYRKPKTASQSLVKYFASSELYISYYISRHFHWFQSILFVEPIISNYKLNCGFSVPMPFNTKVYLSENDNIVDSNRVGTYLNNHNVDSVSMKGLDHASFLFYPTWQNKILSTINRFIS